MHDQQIAIDWMNTRHCIKFITSIISFNPHSISVKVRTIILFVSLEPEENLKSRSSRPFHYLKDTDEVGLICMLTIT